MGVDDEGVARWFALQREKKIKEKMLTHSALVHRTVEKLAELIEIWLERSKVDESVFEELKDLEGEADSMRREVLRMLAEARIEPDLKSYLARVVRQVDWIADWALESARLIRVVGEEGAPPPDLARILRKMAAKAGEAAKAVDECVGLMFRDPIGTLDLCDHVEDIEEEVDALYEEARVEFLRSFESEKPAMYALLFHIIEAVEMVVDKCEDASDNIRELVVRVA